MLLECCDGTFCGIDMMVVQRNELDVDVLRLDVFLMAAEHSLYITFSAGW